MVEKPSSARTTSAGAALAAAREGGWDDATRMLSSALNATDVATAEAVETVTLLSEGGAADEQWQPLQGRLLSALGDRRDILWARLKLLDQGAMQKLSGPPLHAGRWLGKDPDVISIARAEGTEDDFCRTLLVYDWWSLPDIDALLERARGWSEVNRARALSVAAETLMYRHGAFDRACALLEEQLALQERRGSIVEQAKSLVRLTMGLLAAGRLAECYATRDRAREMVDRLGPGYLIHEHVGTTRGGDLYPEISMESNFAWYTEGRWREVADHWVKAIGLEEPGGSPVHIVEAAMAAQAYARLGEFDRAAFYLDELTKVLKQLQPRDWAFNGAAGRAAHAIWDMQAARYAADYRAMALAMLGVGVGDWTNTSLEETVARMAALLSHAEESRQYFAAARKRLGERADDPRIAIFDFDEAVAIRLCPAIGTARRTGLLDKAAAGFEQNGMAGWAERARREREKPAGTA